MRNEFFGDNRDLFKYDLIKEVILGIQTINNFTFIPMLTKDIGKHGNQIDRNKAKAGFKNMELTTYLDNCIDNDRRNIIEISGYYKKNNIRINIYKESIYFENRTRQEYFRDIPVDLLIKSLVFVDPDNGLEIKKSDKKHILYKEIADIFNRMENSILMIFQFIPREKHKEYIERRSNELNQITGYMPIFISDDVIIFFFLTKNDELKEKSTGILKKYKNNYENLFYGPFR
jgi:hypothetical protein